MIFSFITKLIKESRIFIVKELLKCQRMIPILLSEVPINFMIFLFFFREIDFMNLFPNSDLYNAIAEGNYPSYTMYIQVMTFEEAENWKFNPFDLTKVWSHAEFPLIPVGKLVFNRNPRNYFAEVEQLAFSPAHLVPGIEPSPDKMLQV